MSRPARTFLFIYILILRDRRRTIKGRVNAVDLLQANGQVWATDEPSRWMNAKQVQGVTSSGGAWLIRCDPAVREGERTVRRSGEMGGGYNCRTAAIY